jgi:hypothetical protein
MELRSEALKLADDEGPALVGTTATARPGTFHSSITSETRRSNSGMNTVKDSVRATGSDAIRTSLDYLSFSENQR